MKMNTEKTRKPIPLATDLHRAICASAEFATEVDRTEHDRIVSFICHLTGYVKARDPALSDILRGLLDTRLTPVEQYSQGVDA